MSDRPLVAAYRFLNGMIMAFDRAGKQITTLQGSYSPDLHRQLFDASTPETKWVGFGEDGPVAWAGRGCPFTWRGQCPYDTDGDGDCTRCAR